MKLREAPEPAVPTDVGYTIAGRPWTPKDPEAEGGSSRGSHALGASMKCLYRHQLRDHLRLHRRPTKAEGVFYPSISGPAVRGTAGHAHLARFYGGPEPKAWHTDEAIKAIANAYARNFAHEQDCGVLVEEELYANLDQLERFTGLDLACTKDGEGSCSKVTSGEGSCTSESCTLEIGASEAGASGSGASGVPRLLGGPVERSEVFTSRVDTLLDLDGRAAQRAYLEPGMWIVDFKIESPSPRGDLWQWQEGGKYFMLWQAAVNILLARINGYPVLGFAVRRLGGEPPFGYETREVTWPLDQLMDEAPKMIRDGIANYNHVAELTRTGLKAPLTGLPLGECAKFGAKYGCEYQEVCSAPSKRDRAERLQVLYQRKSD